MGIMELLEGNTPVKTRVSLALDELLAEDKEQWITIHPNGEGDNRHIQIDDQTGEILKGGAVALQGTNIRDFGKNMKDLKPEIEGERIKTKEEFDEKEFQKHINKDMEKNFGRYRFIYPESTQEIKDEAVSQNNCVASYIKQVISGNCDILFLRTKENPDKSLVTIEVRNGKIVQAKQKFNDPVDSEQQEAIDKWNKWYANKINNKNNANKESEEQ